MTLLERFKSTSLEFQYKIDTIASANNKSVMAVYGWWREYCVDCGHFDQSPVFSEFQSWNQERLPN